MSGKKDLHINQGETFNFVFTLSKEENGVESPVDLTGVIPKMQIRPSHRSETVILDLTQDNLISVTSPLEGEVKVEIPATVTASLDFSSAVYDIELHFLDNTVMRLVEGKIFLSPEVTRD